MGERDEDPLRVFSEGQPLPGVVIQDPFFGRGFAMCPVPWFPGVTV